MLLFVEGGFSPIERRLDDDHHDDDISRAQKSAKQLWMTLYSIVITTFFPFIFSSLLFVTFLPFGWVQTKSGFLFRFLFFLSTFSLLPTPNKMYIFFSIS